MRGSVLLDTNIIIALLGGDAGVESALHDCESVYLPAIALGELFYGAMRSSRAGENTSRIAEFAAASVVLACDEQTARHYGSVKTKLRSAGRPIPENDIWIASIAVQHGLTVVSRDAHFRSIDGLEILTWT